MYPIFFSFKVGDYTRSVTSYGVFAVIGIFAASFLIVALARRRGIDTFDMVNIIALLVAGGIVLSLFIHFLIFLPDRLKASSLWDIHFGVVSWGGVLGGFLAGLWASKFWKIPFLKLADVVIPGVALGFAFGRIGCHFAGCCFGLHYEGPMALHVIHPLAPASAALQPLFPIQLTSAALLFLLALFLLRLFSLKLRSGLVLGAYAILYGMGRFSVEFFRDDARGVWLRLSDAQWYSVILCSAGLVLIYSLRRSKEAYGN